ncbi:MAG: T9SS type A sorting domain-containing protein [bacterium]|nr:T9SS type A sorting domain-containing protein [bacterium]
MLKFIATIALMLLISSSVAAQSITLDHVDGLVSPGVIASNAPIVFHMRMTVINTGELKGSTNGFVLYSPDNAVWQPPVSAHTGALTPYYEANVFVNEFGIDGSGEDTIAIGGFSINVAKYVPSGFDEIVLTITTQVASSESGKTICIDSSFYKPSNTWKWSTTWNDPLIPTWGGPYCFGIDTPTSAESDADALLPFEFALHQNSPNPFNPTTSIRFDLPRSTPYRLLIMNSLGQMVNKIEGFGATGENEILFDGSSLASGLYFYHLRAGELNASRKMLLLK